MEENESVHYLLYTGYYVQETRYDIKGDTIFPKCNLRREADVVTNDSSGMDTVHP